jgi:hypothetical protein
MLPMLATAAFGQTHDEHDAHDMMGAGPQLTLHGFSDITLHFEKVPNGAGGDSTSNAFALGQFDLYFVSRLAANLSFLGEAAVELEHSGESALDVERVYIRYAWSDYLRVAAGRTHTALGYWNEAFHHGVLLQPTVERPEALKFEDDGGILPVHSVGVEVGGTMGQGDWSLGYVGNVANGRGPTSDLVQGSTDLNRDKAVGVKLSLSKSGSRRFAIGPSFYRDVIPPDPVIVGREGSMDETIYGGHMHYADDHVETLAEYYHLRHEDRLTSAVYNHEGWYALMIVTAGRWKPYGGVDRLAINTQDLFFNQGQRDLTRGTFGLRVDCNPFLPNGAPSRTYLLGNICGTDEPRYRQMLLERMYRGEIDLAPKVVDSGDNTVAFVAASRGLIAIVPATLADSGRVRVLAVAGKAPGATGYPLRE